MKNSVALDIKNLSISFFEKGIKKSVLSGFSFSFKKNKTTAIVGPSGCGKSLLSLACLNLLPKTKNISVSGNIFINNKTCVLGLKKNKNLSYRGIYTSIIFQDPFTSLNPVYTCGYQLQECFLKKNKLNAKNLYRRCLSVFKSVELEDPEKIFNSYPHQLSGGQLQRVLISFSLAFNSKIIIADEITTALDPYVKKQILVLLKKICKKNKISLLLISHDISVVKNYSDEILILKDGNILEFGKTSFVLKNPKNIFTKSLLICKPLIKNNPFFLPFLKKNKIIKKKPILLKKNISENIIELKNLSVNYKNFIALNNINFCLKKNDIIGIIGRSGSGKSTLSNIISLVNRNYSGDFYYKGKNLKNLSKNDIININKKIQLVFQNPDSSLNPKQKIIDCLKEVLFVNNKILNSDKIILKYLKKVELNKDILNKYPHQLSGGQKQRISITRILLSEPEIIIFDESVSALDINTQSYVLNLIKNLYINNNYTIIYISHDISTVSFLCNKIYVLNKGFIVDQFLKENLFDKKRHIETYKLINNIN